MGDEIVAPPLDEVVASTPPQPPKPALVERASLAAFWNAAFLPLKLGARLGASIVVVRMLRLEPFAVLTQLSALLSLLGTVSDLGVERALPRFIPEFEMAGGRAGLSTLLRCVTVIKALTLLPFVGALLLFPGFFIDRLQLSASDRLLLPTAQVGVDTATLLLGMIAVLLVLGAASDISIQVLYAYFRQKMTNALDILNALLIPGLRALLVVPLGVLGALLALLLGTIVSVALSVRLMFRALAEERLGLRSGPAAPGANGAARQPRRPSAHSVWRRFSAYSAIMYLNNVAAMLYDQPFVVLLLGLTLADSDRKHVEVALIGLAFQFVRQLLQALVVPLTGVQTPLFARLYAENRIDGLRTAYTSLTRFLILVLLPAGAGLILMTRNLLMLLYGQVGGDAVLPLPRLGDAVVATAILAVGLFGESMIGVALQVLLVYEEHRAVLIARASALVSVPLLLLLEPPFGVIGAAAAVALAALGSRTVALAFGLRRLGLTFPWAFLGQVALATIPFLLIITPLAYLLPEDAGKLFSPRWLGIGLADFGLILGAMVLFWWTFRRLGGLLPEDKARFAGIRIPGIKVLLRYL